MWNLLKHATSLTTHIKGRTSGQVNSLKTLYQNPTLPYPTTPTDKDTFSFLLTASEIMNSYYPERVVRIAIINAPMWFR